MENCRPKNQFARILTLLVVGVFLSINNLSAQQTINFNHNEIEGETIPRVMLASAIDHVTNSDGNIVLLFTDSHLVLQLTNNGLDKITSSIRSDSRDTEGSGSFFSDLLRSALSTSIYTLLDHGIAIPLDNISHATYSEGQLIIYAKNNTRILKDSSFNDKSLMTDFIKKDAKKFAKSLNDYLKE